MMYTGKKAGRQADKKPVITLPHTYIHTHTLPHTRLLNVVSAVMCAHSYVKTAGDGDIRQQPMLTVWQQQKQQLTHHHRHRHRRIDLSETYT